MLQSSIVVPAQKTTPINDVPVPFDQLASRKIKPPELLQRDKAEYPDDARIKQIDGLCSITMVVGTQGDPGNVRILHCTDVSFEESSLDAVRRYQFNPAMTQDGKPVLVTAAVVLKYHLAKYSLPLRTISWWLPDRLVPLDRRMTKADFNQEMGTLIHFGFVPVQSGTSNSGPNGIFPFTREVTGPRVIKFSDEGYGHIAFVREGNSACDVMLTIDAKGRASDPQVTHCERTELEKPAVESLLRSTYRPGFVRGKEVSMRGLMHLTYGDAEGSAAPLTP
jgi:TonB family protein